MAKEDSQEISPLRVLGENFKINKLLNALSTRNKMEETMNGKIDLKDKTSRVDYDLHEKLFKKRIWNLEDLSLFTGFSIKTIQNRISEERKKKTRSKQGNYLPYTKRCGRLFFSPNDILNWIEEGE